MYKDIETNVLKFYDTIGWQEVEEGITEDARIWEDLREVATEYVSKCRLRVAEYIPEYGENILDMASGPIQFKEYQDYSKNFKKRYCIDLSARALAKAKNKIGNHGVFIAGSFFDIPFKENFFDCSISLHTIYHIHKDQQEEAVRKLVKVTKPGQPIIIVYINPNSWIALLKTSLGKANLLSGLSVAKNNKLPLDLYFYAYPLNWWERFNDVATINILPWRSFETKVQKIIIPNNHLGEKILKLLFFLEGRYPIFFAKQFTYPMIILRKNIDV